MDGESATGARQVGLIISMEARIAEAEDAEERKRSSLKLDTYNVSPTSGTTRRERKVSRPEKSLAGGRT